MVIDIGTSCVEYIVAAQVSPFVIPAVRVLRLTFLGCCYEIMPSGFPAAFNPNPCGNGYHRISDINRGKSPIKTMSRLGFREPLISEPAISTHTPRKICPSKFHNNSPIPHTHRYVLLHFFFFASSFLRGSSNSSSQHFLIRGGNLSFDPLSIRSSYTTQTWAKKGEKKN